jgi:hypothetical protein
MAVPEAIAAWIEAVTAEAEAIEECAAKSEVVRRAVDARGAADTALFNASKRREAAHHAAEAAILDGRTTEPTETS